MPFPGEIFKGKDGTLFRIRSFIPGDSEQFARFLDLASRETAFTNEIIGEPKDPVKLGRGLKRMEEMPGMFWAGAWMDAELVGFLGIRGVAPGHPFFKHVGSFDLMILKKAWGKGLGGRMMQILDAQAEKLGYARMEAVAKEGNDRALGLYKKHGYQIEGKRRAAALIEGKLIDEYYIAKLAVQKHP